MRLRNIPAAYPAIAASPYCVTDGADMGGNWANIFGESVRDGAFHIEIGMGKGQFLLEMARQNPNVRYLGIEMYESVLYRALQKFEADAAERKNPLPNLRFFRADATHIDEYFAQGEVGRIYLNFSDPWHKARHAKRRLTSPAYLLRYDKILANDGRIEFKTDNEPLFDFSIESVEASEIWQIAALTRDLHHDDTMNAGNIMTEYEAKFSAQGNPIFKMIVTRK